MRAARIHAWRDAPVIEEIAVPHRGIGETLVRIEAAAVSHLDLTVATGEFGLRPPLPYVPGCEGAGVVVESDTYTVGRQVFFRDGSIGLDRDGTWREYAAVPDHAAVPLHTPLDPAVAATFFVPTTTAYIALHDIGGLQAGQTVIISGAAGAVGSMAVQVAQAAGAQVIALVSRSTRLSELPAGVQGIALDDAGATGELDASRPGDLLLDTIGGSALNERIGWVKPGGKVAALGYTAGTALTLDLPTWLFSDVSILPVNLLGKQQRALEVAERLLPRIADGSMTVNLDEFGLDQAAELMRLLAAGRISGRAVIRL